VREQRKNGKRPTEWGTNNANGNRTKLGSIGIFAALVGLVVIILSYPGYKQNLITCTSIGKHGGLRESLPFLLHSLL